MVVLAFGLTGCKLFYTPKAGDRVVYQILVSGTVETYGPGIEGEVVAVTSDGSYIEIHNADGKGGNVWYARRDMCLHQIENN